MDLDSTVFEDEEIYDDFDGEYEVETILDERIVNDMYEYLVKFKDFPESDNSWVPLEHLNCRETIRQFKKNRNKQENGNQENNEKQIERTLAKRTLPGNFVQYLVKWFDKKGTGTTWMSEDEVTKMALASLTKQAELTESSDEEEIQHINAANVGGIFQIAKTDSDGVKCLVKFKDSDVPKWLSLSVVKQYIPFMIIDYYETLATQHMELFENTFVCTKPY